MKDKSVRVRDAIATLLRNQTKPNKTICVLFHISRIFLLYIETDVIIKISSIDFYS
jgi:hypothetical protein